MRLIDADVLLEKMKHRRDYVGRPSDPVCLVEDVPTVDAAPVTHAHWIEYYTDIMCSHCHATYKDEIVDMYQDGVDHRRYVGLEYCPHCGSIMDGGDE